MIAGALACVCIAGGVCAGAVMMKGGQDAKQDTASQKVVSIPEIQFPSYGGEWNEEITFENKIDADAVNNQDMVNQVMFVKDKASKEKSEKIKNAFDVKEGKMTDTDNAAVYKEDDRTLMLYDNGSFLYRQDRDETGEVKLSDESCKEMAQEFLEDNQLLTDEFEYVGVGYDTLTDLSNPEEEKVIGKLVYYERKINGIDVEGNSKIYVAFDNQGEISEAYSSYREVERTVEPNEVVALEAAIEKAEKLEGYIVMDEEADRIVLENAEIIYWEDSEAFSTNNTIQPVYKITGKAYKGDELLGEFAAVESAVK